jgi:predicted lipid-binding transport protein (Tim44 family)
VTSATDTAGLVYEPSAEAGLRQLLANDRNFDAGRFMEGARAAYRMILEAFWKGDRETLRDLCDDDSYDAFVEAIDAREARGETLENRLIRIDSAKITAAELNRGEARITVRYHADISAITRDADGKLIAGSMSDAAQTDDLWTFRRQIGSNDPNWLLDEAESA